MKHDEERRRIKEIRALNSQKVIQALEKRKELLKMHGVRKLGLFGSFIKGKQHKRSDIDFLVTFNKPSFDNYMNLKFLLEKVFGKKVDLVIEKNIKPALKHIKKEAVYAKI